MNDFFEITVAVSGVIQPGLVISESVRNFLWRNRVLRGLPIALIHHMKIDRHEYESLRPGNPTYSNDVRFSHPDLSTQLFIEEIDLSLRNPVVSRINVTVVTKSRVKGIEYHETLLETIPSLGSENQQKMLELRDRARSFKDAYEMRYYFNANLGNDVRTVKLV